MAAADWVAAVTVAAMVVVGSEEADWVVAVG